MKTQTKKISKRIFRIIGAVLLALAAAAIAAVLVFFLTYRAQLSKLDNSKGVENSIYSEQFKGKKVMVLVPQEDDDLLIAGQVLPEIYKNGADTRVVFVTNGDKFFTARQRQDEARDSLKTLGIPKDKIIFLGYPDGGTIFINKSGKLEKSFSSGLDHTNSGKHFVDYHFSKYGTHAQYTRQNVLSDIKDAILDYCPDYIIAIDFDDHRDHRGVSMCFEEVMGNILREKQDYKPVVLKCFGYSSAWRANPDFYQLNIKSVHKPVKDRLNDPTYETDVPQYNWSDRIRLPVYSGAVSHSILKCPDYKALSKHLTQFAYTLADRIINGDMVYWNRRTDSLTYDADITVSSGNAKLLNDFKLVSTDRTLPKKTKFNGCVSSFKKDDNEKSVTVKFRSPKKISCISLYDDYNLDKNILGGIITFSDGSSVEVPSLNANGSETRVEFAPKEGITSFTFKVTSFEGDTAGLCEIEAFEKTDYDLGFSFVKIKNADTDDYMYNYFVEPDTSELILGISSSDSRMSCTLKIVNGSGVKLNGNKLEFDSGFKKCTVRAEVDGHPEIYDQITVTRLSEKELQNYYKFQQTDKKLFKANSEWLKLENIIKNGKFDSYFIDMIKELEKDIEKEIYN